MNFLGEETNNSGNGGGSLGAEDQAKLDNFTRSGLNMTTVGDLTIGGTLYGGTVSALTVGEHAVLDNLTASGVNLVATGDVKANSLTSNNISDSSGTLTLSSSANINIQPTSDTTITSGDLILAADLKQNGVFMRIKSNDVSKYIQINNSAVDIVGIGELKAISAGLNIADNLGVSRVAVNSSNGCVIPDLLATNVSLNDLNVGSNITQIGVSAMKFQSGNSANYVETSDTDVKIIGLSTIDSAGAGITMKDHLGSTQLTLNTGGISVDNLTVSGTLSVIGPAATYNTVEITDTLLKIADNNIADNVNMGIYGEYDNSGLGYWGLCRDKTTKEAYLVDSATEPLVSTDLTTLALGNLNCNTISCGTTEAFTLPRLDLSTRKTITPAAGMLCYNSDHKYLEFYDGSQWKRVGFVYNQFIPQYDRTVGVSVSQTDELGQSATVGWSDFYDSTYNGKSCFNWQISDDQSAGYWATVANSYTATTGVYTGAVSTSYDATSMVGEYISLTFDTTAKPLYKYKLYSTSDGFSGSFCWKVHRLVASNDGVSWTSVAPEISWTPAIAYETKEVVLTDTDPYKYYRWIVNSTNGGTHAKMLEIECFQTSDSPAYVY